MGATMDMGVRGGVYGTGCFEHGTWGLFSLDFSSARCFLFDFFSSQPCAK